jgi:multidrug efflux pump subunit AcrB
MNTGSEAKFNLSAWALKNQQMVSFFMLLVIAMGVFCYEKLPRNEDPAFTIKTAVVSAQWPGASVADTTRLLTDTLEKSCRKRPGWTISKVKPGPDAPLSTSTSVTIRPRNAPDIWYQVRKKMQDIAPSLPEGVQGPAVDDEFDDTFGTIYAFIPEGFTLREVRDRAETIRRELMSLPDIGKTTLLGEQQEQWVLAFSPARLAGMGLDIQEVADALRAQNAVVPAGTMRTGQENMAIKVSGALTTEESLRAVTLHVNNRYIPLTDIATVTREIAEPPAPAYRVNGKPAIGLAVSMAPTGTCCVSALR